MKPIILAGGSGFLGGLLAAHLPTSGYEIIVLTRTPKAARKGVREMIWDGCTVGSWAAALEGAAAVINLTGRSVNCRYNEQNRRLIMASRVNATRAIGAAIAGCKVPPPVWLNASTATIYKHTFGPAWDEAGQMADSPAAKDEFSFQVATAWEKALQDSPTIRTRKIALRAALVLGRHQNSAYPVLRRLARMGLGGRMGSGKQFVSWIHETDFCRAIEWLIQQETLSGPVNICAPQPLPNAEMMKLFRQASGMPLGLPAANWMLAAGAFVLRTETELIVKSRRVVPRRLLESGFTFRFPSLPDALQEFATRREE